ncbi:MAG TPA: PQQ-dependent dehydrogenase, methanol/ethanol family [Nevskiaceae bacterium]|nr:PQQ-dependent dehydrogenase, methanol/ethanol family [Nevskiaceae bacterium]
MSRVLHVAAVAAAVTFGVGAVAVAAEPPNAVAGVDTQSIVTNAATTTNWPSYGLDYASTRFSALKQVDDGNVGKLGLAWTFDLKSTHHGVESTPIVVNGVMYVTTGWNVVYALNAVTGQQLWSYDPHTPRSVAIQLCCDAVNRGVAVYQGRVYEGTLDGRLIALDAATGKLDWSADTTEMKKHYTITGAPLAVDGKVIIGNGGAEYEGVRGYVSAYNAKTGKLDWRWYTVPGNPANKPENAAMAAARKTWDPKTKYWEKGGGGTVWNAFAYDPKLGLLYFGTGNAVPWSRQARGGKTFSSKYTTSIVALKLATGKYVWSYQPVIADPSDYDTTQALVLADLKIKGKSVPVIMQGEKDGFFYVLNRRTGRFISANNFVPQNWAKGYTKDGKPIETGIFNTPAGKAFPSLPGPFGGMNWQTMSFSPHTGLAYLPAQLVPTTMSSGVAKPTAKKHVGGFMSGNGWNLGMQLNPVPPKGTPFGRLIAWNPVTQSQVWAQDYPAPWNGGTLATAGNLVFQGTATGQLMAYDAKTGKKLWTAQVGQGVIAAPMTYSVDGKQYVSVAVGWGGVAGESFQASGHEGPGTVFTYVLDGKMATPSFAAYPNAPFLTGVKFNPKDVKAGTAVYINHCAICHGTPGANTGGSVPNLGHSPTGMIDNLQKIVFNGPFVDNGMPDFTGRLTQQNVEQLKAFIQATTNVMAKAAAAKK